MEQWISHSNPAKQIAAAVGLFAVGVVMVIGFRDFRGADSNALAGFLLGVLLVVLGLVGVAASTKQTVVVDPRARRITVDDVGLLRRRTRTIAFDDVVHVGIGYLGKKSNFVTWYSLTLKLRTGGEYSLFAPGRFFPGGSDRATVAGWQHRLERYLAGEGSAASPKSWTAGVL